VTHDLVLQNALVIAPSGVFRGGIAIDGEEIVAGIQEGAISVVGTDSLCYSASFKTEADFWDCRVGINLQVADTLALLFDEGVNRGRIDLPTLARILSENAASVANW
jgi:dihydroorotase-like cyclic amidohydrolase